MLAAATGDFDFADASVEAIRSEPSDFEAGPGRSVDFGSGLAVLATDFGLVGCASGAGER